MHALFFCSLTKDFWRHSIYWPILKKNKAATLLEVSREILRILLMDAYEVWIIAMWSVWYFICKVKHGGDFGKMEVGIDFAKGFLEAFHAAASSHKECQLE